MALLEYETLSGDEVKTIMSGKKIKRDDDSDKPAVAAVTGKNSSWKKTLPEAGETIGSGMTPQPSGA